MATIEDVNGHLISIEGTLDSIAQAMLGKTKGGEENADTRRYRQDLNKLAKFTEKFVDNKVIKVFEDLTKTIKDQTKETKQTRELKKGEPRTVASAAAGGGGLGNMKKVEQSTKAISEDMEGMAKASKEVNENFKSLVEEKNVKNAFASISRSVKSQGVALNLNIGSWKKIISNLRYSNDGLAKGVKLTSEEVYNVTQAVSYNEKLYVWQKWRLQGLAKELEGLVKANKLEEARLKFKELAKSSEKYGESARKRAVAGEGAGNVVNGLKAISGLLDRAAGIAAAAGGVEIFKVDDAMVKGAKEYADYNRKISDTSFITKGLNEDQRKQYVAIAANATEIYLRTGQTAEIYRDVMLKNLSQGVTDQEKLKDLTDISLQTATLIGSEAKATADAFKDWHLKLKLDSKELKVIQKDLQKIALSTGISGDNLLEAFNSTQGVAQQMKWAGTYTTGLQRSLTQTAAIAKQLGVESQTKNIQSALGSSVGFDESDQKTQNFLLQAAHRAGLNPTKVVMGELTEEEQKKLTGGMKALESEFQKGGIGDRQVRERFGFKSAGEMKAHREARERGEDTSAKGLEAANAAIEEPAQAQIRIMKEQTGEFNKLKDAMEQFRIGFEQLGAAAAIEAMKFPGVVEDTIKTAIVMSTLVDWIEKLIDALKILIPLLGIAGLAGAIMPFLYATGWFALLAGSAYILYKAWTNVSDMLNKTAKEVDKLIESVDERMRKNYTVEKIRNYTAEDAKKLQGDVTANEKNLPFLKNQAMLATLNPIEYALEQMMQASGVSPTKISDEELRKKASTMEEGRDKTRITAYLTKLEETERQKLALEAANKLQAATSPAEKEAILKAYGESKYVKEDRALYEENKQKGLDFQTKTYKDNRNDDFKDFDFHTQEKFNAAGLKDGSIFTHDTHLEDILEEMAIPLAKVAPDLGGTTQFDRQKMYGFDDDTPISKAMEETTVSMDKVEQNTAEANRHLSNMVGQLEQIIDIFGGNGTISSGDTTSDWKPKSPANYWSTAMAAMTGSPLLGNTGNPAL